MTLPISSSIVTTPPLTPLATKRGRVERIGERVLDRLGGLGLFDHSLLGPPVGEEGAVLLMALGGAVLAEIDLTRRPRGYETDFK